MFGLAAFPMTLSDTLRVLAGTVVGKVLFTKSLQIKSKAQCGRATCQPLLCRENQWPSTAWSQSSESSVSLTLHTNGIYWQAYIWACQPSPSTPSALPGNILLHYLTYLPYSVVFGDVFITHDLFFKFINPARFPSPRDWIQSRQGQLNTTILM